MIRAHDVLCRNEGSTWLVTAGDDQTVTCARSAVWLCPPQHCPSHSLLSVAVRFFPGTFRKSGARAALQQEEQAEDRGLKRAKYDEGGDLEVARTVGGDAGVQVIMVLVMRITFTTTRSHRCSVRGCLWVRRSSHRQRQVTNHFQPVLLCLRHSSYCSAHRRIRLFSLPLLQPQVQFQTFTLIWSSMKRLLLYFVGVLYT